MPQNIMRSSLKNQISGYDSSKEKHLGIKAGKEREKEMLRIKNKEWKLFTAKRDNCAVNLEDHKEGRSLPSKLSKTDDESALFILGLLCSHFFN